MFGCDCWYCKAGDGHDAVSGGPANKEHTMSPLMRSDAETEAEIIARYDLAMERATARAQENLARARGAGGGKEHKKLMARVASLLSELGGLKSASLSQAREARELIHLIGKEIGVKSER